MPELKKAQSKCGSLENITHKPGGGAVKIYSRPVDFDKQAAPRVNSRNDGYVRQGGDVKIFNEKPDFAKVQPKVRSLENVNYVAGGGEKKVFNQPVIYK